MGGRPNIYIYNVLMSIPVTSIALWEDSISFRGSATARASTAAPRSSTIVVLIVDGNESNDNDNVI